MPPEAMWIPDKVAGWRWRASPTRKASGEPGRFRVSNLSGG
jgi:hypothetical protein